MQEELFSRGDEVTIDTDSDYFVGERIRIVPTVLTGEANHHHAIDAKRLGLSLIAAGHYATEFPVTAAVAEKLRTAFPELEVLVSEDARDPYTYL